VHDDIATSVETPLSRRARFRAYYRSRPFIGGALTVVAGLEIFLSGQLDLTVGKFHVALGIEGLQATIIPLILVVLGVLAIVMPVHRVFYGVISLALSVYSLVGVNLGGFFIGMILGIVGGILIVSWLPKKNSAPTETDVATRLEDSAAEPRPFVRRRPSPARNALVASTHLRSLLPRAAGREKAQH
jgi:hypothetical protein